MKRWQFGLPALAAALVFTAILALPRTASAQNTQPTLTSHPSLLRVNWFGPFGISPNDTARFVYTNLGVDDVLIEWAFTNAETGELVCGNFGKPAAVAAGRGAIWEYQQTLSVDPASGAVTETRICDNKPVVSDELYFDAKRRHELVAWIFIQHSDARGFRNAVDLPTVQLYNSFVAPALNGAGTPSPTFGRSFVVLYANPTAPPEFPKALLR